MDTTVRSGAGTTTDDVVALLGAAAGTLADDPVHGLSRVLADAVDGLGLTSAVLRDATGGGLRAVAGDVVHAVPARRRTTGPEAVVELPVHGDGVRLATLTVVGARPSQLPALRALCAVLGLALAGASAALPVALLAAADADADAVADDLHDGPVQELVFARFAADAAVRNGDAAGARDAVQSALQSLRRSLWLVRPRGAADGGLAGVLPQLSARLVEAGRAGLVLDVDDDASGALAAPAAGVAYRLVQACARTTPDAVAVRLSRTPGQVRLRVTGTGPLPAPERWTARARAVGARLTTDSSGAVELAVPVVPAPEQIEAIP